MIIQKEDIQDKQYFFQVMNFFLFVFNINKGICTQKYKENNLFCSILGDPMVCIHNIDFLVNWSAKASRNIKYSIILKSF